jgi:hypothetical protein
MPNPAQITLATLRDQIKQEARVKGSDTLDTFVDSLVNELLLDYALNNRYFELLITNYSIATLQSTGDYALPTDFMAERLVRYQPTNGAARTLNKRNEYMENARGTLPRWYDLTTSKLSIFPYTDVPVGDAVLLDYYKLPDTLTANSNFPIPRLLPSLKLRAIHRVMIYNNSLQTASALKGDSVEIEHRSKPSS